MKAVWQKAPVTFGLVVVMVVVYAAMFFTGGLSVSHLVSWGALYPPLVRAGQWWRLITAGFLHAGFEHLLMNCLTLYLIGYYVEGLFGHWRIAALFLTSVIGGNVISMAFSPLSLSVGASTGIFGLFGAFIFLGSEFRDYEPVRLTARQFLILVGINVVFDLFMPNVGLAAHLGGLLVGFLAAAILGAPRLGAVAARKRIIAALLLVVVLVLCILKG